MHSDNEQLQKKRILVVDDDNVTRRILTRALERSGYMTSSASNASEGEEIVNELGSRNFSCAVVDYRMPGKDGIEFLTWLKEQDETLSAIMLTAEGDKKLVAKILREGAVDYLDKPVEIPEFRESIANALSVTREKRRLADTDSAAEAIGEAQLQMLGFKSLTESEGVQICFRPMHQASGDFVGIFNSKENTKRIIAGDVSGHDLRAAYFSTFSQGVVRGMMQNDASDEDIFKFFNNFLNNEWNNHSDSPNPTSIALCGVEINQSDSTVKIINSGFPNPCLIAADGEVKKLGIGSCPLGWFDEENFEIDWFEIPKDSSIYLWSDGLEDYAEHKGISVFAMAYRLLNPLSKRDQQANLKEAIDDILVMKLEVNPKEQDQAIESFVPLLQKSFTGEDEHLVDEYRKWIESSLRFAIPDLSEDKEYDIMLCIREALLNGIVHGCKGLLDQTCDILVSYNAQGRQLRVRISDTGDGYDDSYLNNKDMGSDEPDPLGRHTGFILLKEIPDNIYTENGGSVVIMKFNV